MNYLLRTSRLGAERAARVSHRSPFLLLPAMLLTGFGLSVPSQAASAAGPWVQQPFAAQAPAASAASSAKAIAQLKASGQYDSLSAAIVRARYGVRAVEGDASCVWAQNPNNNLNSSFSARGVRFRVTVPQQGTRKAKAYQSAWRLQRLGTSDVWVVQGACPRWWGIFCEQSVQRAHLP